MSVANDASLVVDKKIWNAWLQKTKAREQRTAYGMRIAMGIAVCIFIGVTLYLLR